MALASMTGFARKDGSEEGLSWTWEVRSVNGRGLDVRFRLPSGLDRLESTLRTAANAVLSRGNLQVSLSIETATSSQSVTVNRDLIKALVSEISSLKKELGPEITLQNNALSLDSILSIRGVLEIADIGTDLSSGDFDDAIGESFEELIAALAVSRKSEGAKLEVILRDQLGQMSTQIDLAVALQPDCQQRTRERLRRQIEELTAKVKSLDEGRLEQELAVILVKNDVTEEIDRLSAHIAAALELLDGGGVMGRKIDFLVQELNRETNTLCAKSAHIGLTQVGLELKAIVDQFREQALNVE